MQRSKEKDLQQKSNESEVKQNATRCMEARTQAKKKKETYSASMVSTNIVFGNWFHYSRWQFASEDCEFAYRQDGGSGNLSAL